MTYSIKGFVETSFIDWPGRVVSVLFLPSCNLRCPFCHNHGLVLHPETYPDFPWEAILEGLRKRRGWIDGVCLTGGEPTLHPWLPLLIRELKSDRRLTPNGEPLAVKLDTNGTRPEVLKELLTRGLVESVALDVKAPLDERYRRATGRPDFDVGAIQRSLRLLGDWGGEYELRTTVCPAVLSPEDVVELAAEVAGAPRLVLQQFQPGHCLDPALNDVAPYPEEQLEELAERCRAYVAQTWVRGSEAVPSPPLP